MESQKAGLIIENGVKLLVFGAKHFSKYAIVYSEDSVYPPSFNSGGNKVSSGSKISILHHQAYIAGYPDCTFRPDNYMTRAEAVVVLSRLLLGYNLNYVYNTPFTDVSNNSWYNQNIGFMYNKELISGYADGTFKPNNNMSRAEFAVLIARFSEMPVLSNYSNVFVDTNAHWAETYINALSENGFVQGYGDDTFRPEEYITRAEAVTIINAVTEREPSIERINSNMHKYIVDINDIDGHWSYYEIIEALVSHPSSDFHSLNF